MRSNDNCRFFNVLRFPIGVCAGGKVQRKPQPHILPVPRLTRPEKNGGGHVGHAWRRVVPLLGGPCDFGQGRPEAPRPPTALSSRAQRRTYGFNLSCRAQRSGVEGPWFL